MRLTPLLGAYSGTQATGTGYYEQEESGGQSEGQEFSDNIGWQYVQANSAGSAFNGRALGELPFQNFIDHTVDDSAFQLRYQDIVQVEIIGGGGLSYAAVGFFSAAGGVYDPRDYQGFFWAMLEDGLWHAMLTSYSRSQPPTKILRRTPTAIAATDITSLGLVADGQTKTLFWIADNQVVDFYTPLEWVEGGVDKPKWRARISVINDNAKLRMHGGGDAYIISLGEVDAFDIIAASVDKPVLSVVGVGVTEAQFSSSAFVHTPGDANHLASKWQVTLSSDPTFATPFYDSGWECDDLTSHVAVGLPAGTDLLARVMYIADDGTQSPWSDGVPFTTLDEADPGVTPPWPVCEPPNPTIWTSE